MSNHVLAVAAIVLGVAVLQVANGVIGTFLPIRLKVEGFSTAAIGLVATAQALGFLVGCLAVPGVIRSLGHIRAFAVFAAATSAAALALAIAIEPGYWIGLRLATGFCSAGLFTVAESWLNDRTPSSARGSVISIYMIVNKMAFVAGQLLLTVGDIGGTMFFMVASAFYSLSLIPVATTRSTSPALPPVARLPLARLYRIAPAAAVGCFATGLSNPAVIAITPVYGTSLGYSAATIAGLLAALQVGSLLMQWPLGWVSDRVDRRAVILVCAGVVAAVSWLIAAMADAPVGVVYLLYAVWGAFGLSVYSVCIAHANDFAPPGMTVPLSSTLLLAWASGSVIGPTAATLVMEVVGPRGLFDYSAAVFVATGLFVAWRMTRRRAVPAEEREPFVNVPATSPSVMELDPRRG
jgi:MFS family permease